VKSRVTTVTPSSEVATQRRVDPSSPACGAHSTSTSVDCAGDLRTGAVAGSTVVAALTIGPDSQVTASGAGAVACAASACTVIVREDPLRTSRNGDVPGSDWLN